MSSAGITRGCGASCRRGQIPFRWCRNGPNSCGAVCGIVSHSTSRRRVRRGPGSRTRSENEGRANATAILGMSGAAKLIFLYRKMAAGESTLARELAERENAILLVQDEFLDSLYPGEITDIPGFAKYPSRLGTA